MLALLTFLTIWSFGKIDINLWGGLTTISMEKLNKIVDSMVSNTIHLETNFESFGGSGTISYSKFGLGLIVALTLV